jgi:hypothetical protein
VREEEVLLILFTMLILGGVSVLWLAMWNRRKLREMEHRERLAMIQHGLMPAPEADPIAFEQHAGFEAEPESRAGARWRSGGIFLIGIGFALMTMIAFLSGNAQAAIGVGGAFAVLGATFLLNGVFTSSRRRPAWPPRMPPPARHPSQVNARHVPPPPPPNIGP